MVACQHISSHTGKKLLHIPLASLKDTTATLVYTYNCLQISFVAWMFVHMYYALTSSVTGLQAAETAAQPQACSAKSCFNWQQSDHYSSWNVCLLKEAKKDDKCMGTFLSLCMIRNLFMHSSLFDLVALQAVASGMPGRTAAQCRAHWSTVIKPGMRKGPWSDEESAMLAKVRQILTESPCSPLSCHLEQ